MSWERCTNRRLVLARSQTMCIVVCWLGCKEGGEGEKFESKKEKEKGRESLGLMVEGERERDVLGRWLRKRGLNRKTRGKNRDRTRQKERWVGG